MKSHLSPSPRARDTGVALIITLFFLVLVSVVVVGFLSTVRVDRVAAGSHFERMRAQTLAGEGIERVKSVLQQNICDPPVDPSVSTSIPRNWVSSPGMLVVPTTKLIGATNRTRLTTNIPLSSGAAVDSAGNPLYSTNDLVFRAPDLNTELLVDQSPPTHLLNDQIDPKTNAAVKMQVAWIYVRKDGTYDTDTGSLNTTNTTNPIVGRFAYWADDESSKVNYNLAWMRDPAVNANPPGDPTKIDLPALPQFTPAIANAVHGFITTNNYTTINRFFNSPFDARLQADPTTRQVLDLNKFTLTHYNSDPDTTYYGQPRMMLTTQLSNAVVRDAAGSVIMVGGKPLTRPFLDILKNPSNSMAYIDPGITGVVSASAPGGSNGNVDATKLNTVVNTLITNYLERTDWPMVDGAHSIQEKYYALYPTAQRNQRLAQLALNIIDYVRSAESKLMVAQPIRAKWIGNVFTPDFVNQSIQGTDDTFKGLTRQLHITEMSMWVSPTPETSGSNVGRYRSVALVEVYLPPNYGLNSLDLSNTDGSNVGWRLYFDEMNKKDPTDPAGKAPLYYRADGKTAALNEAKIVIPKNPASSQAFLWEAQTTATKNNGVMGPGQYRIFAMEVWRTQPRDKYPNVTLRAAITVDRADGPRIDVAPLATPLNFTLDPGAGAEMDVTSFETVDPRVNGVTKDWIKDTKNSFEAPDQAMLSSLGASPLTAINGKAITVSQDVDTNGKVTSASMRMPPPYSTSNPATGRVRSAGELGLIHAGIEGSNSAPTPGIPFRSLHLQPSKQNTSTVPDWAFMDLFTVPAPVPILASGIFTPHSNSAGGRVNVNAKPDPFDIQRTDPLTAVISGALSTTTATTPISLATAQQIAKNIYNHNLAGPQAAPPESSSLPPGKLYPLPPPLVPPSTTPLNVYESPGEICEIAGVADGGEESEELIREIGNLITARGNVFSIYTVGQALKQTPAGKLVVTAEQRQQAMIERYQINKGTATLSDDSIGLRTLYFRDLTP
ncbi:hypothetical protein CfE428DRAFT_0960 [Chthoniobacter flavus Ellin428]|uniref:Uncharacterized protein n=1 Tax=Chthoniobacter flavus Ellin428 TaxID=497964 RepID=B4CWC3_9BACT|nr:hypothetical protein [Chthoniobacter flavus]EDY21715.1 hypothetical protein CfE428DRAFT_0960 [Chthoniobacter flavus Ellin428]TCO95650.1 hypothetical protein EV701_101337 [Chthoniobacter flavus]